MAVQVEAAPPRWLKYKRGKVSAVRDFPPGCGRRGVLLKPAPAKPEEPTCSQEEALLIAAKLEEMELAGSSEPPKLQLNTEERMAK